MTSCQLIRTTLLSILDRFPHSEAMRQYVTEVHALMIHLLRNDNEDMGVQAIKITINIHRTYKTLLEQQSMAFVEWITELYKGMEDVLEKTFKSDEPSETISPSASLTGFGSEVIKGIH